MNKTEYDDENLLPLSGIQHFQFCRRQWALIYIEQQWNENVLTAEGRLMHARTNRSDFVEVRQGVIASRAMPVVSHRLGLYGVCDVVEFTPDEEGIFIPGRQGRFMPAPVEYKHGKVKANECDEVQVCAQAMCLEEMLCTTISSGWLFYGEIRHRVQVELSGNLRGLVEKIAREMHEYFARGYTPRVKPSKGCKACSLREECLPILMEGQIAASQYIQLHINEK